MKKIYVLGGGTVFHVRPHLAISAPAYGKSAISLFNKIEEKLTNAGNITTEVHLGLTKMAIGSMAERRNGQRITMIGESNQDVAQYLERIVTDPDTKMIFMSVALCDFEGHILDEIQRLTRSGKREPRLKTKNGDATMHLRVADKLIGQIRAKRKDIFLIGFKTTAGMPEDAQYEAGLDLLKKNSCNLVLANDVQNGQNMIICPELATYSITHDRDKVLTELVNMAMSRSSNTFTRTDVVGGTDKLIAWNSPSVPETLRNVVDWCVSQGAYKAFNDVTVGHFGMKVGGNTLISSRRRQNFNRPECRDLVQVDFVNERQVAHGAKPSAGARSQYEVLSRYDDLNCIVHFHCPMKSHSLVPVRSQKEFECGSHQCGINTATGMVRINQHLAAVMLDKHGPNIVFSDKADPQMVIDFIRSNFTLSDQSR